MYRIGVDVGGTKTEVSLFEFHRDFTYQVIAQARFPTPRDKTIQTYASELALFTQSLLAQKLISFSQVESIGIGLPGSIHPVQGIMRQGSLRFLISHSLHQVFGNELKQFDYTGPIHFDNDANCFALAEAKFGAAKTWAIKNNIATQDLCMVGVILGTGVGGGLIVNGSIVRGKRGGAGEIGHTTLVRSNFDPGQACYCGKFGCAEQYLSGPAFERSYATRVLNAAENKKTSKEIFQLIEASDPVALATLNQYRDHLVTYLSNLSNIMDPHVIVLGGGMSLQPRIYENLSERLSEACFLTEDPPAVIPNECGDSSGGLGAAILGMNS